MVRSRTYTAAGLLTVIFILTVLYIFLLRPWVEQAYEGQAPSWFQSAVETVYPRFGIEKQRFDLTFFQYKADQVLIRSCLVIMAAAFWLFLSSPNRLVTTLSLRYSMTKFVLLRLIFYGGLLLYTWHWYEDFAQMEKMRAFYRPLHLYRLLDLPLPSQEVFYGFFFIYLFSLFMVILGYHKVLFASTVALLLITFLGFLYSFEKIDHGYTTLSYAALLMPLLFIELHQQPSGKYKKSYLLFLIQLTIASTYLLAGLEKLLTSGLHWASAATFRAYIDLHQHAFGMWVAQNDLLASLLPALALLFQLSFILILAFPRYKYFFLVAGVGFHWGTRLLFGIGSFFSSWLFVYLFLLNWENILEKCGCRLSSTSNSQKAA